MPNTEAESVDENIDARRKAVTRLTPSAGNIKPDNMYINTPVSNAVNRTPIVASTTPGPIIGLIS
jgi:hypothetical protein